MKANVRANPHMIEALALRAGGKIMYARPIGPMNDR
jgi:hypothetical protein